jgi:hypothetical protein
MELFSEVNMVDVTFVLMGFVPIVVFVALVFFTNYALLLTPLLLWWLLKTYKAYNEYLHSEEELF